MPSQAFAITFEKIVPYIPAQISAELRQALNIEVVIAGAISCNPFVPHNGSVESQSNFTYR